MTDRELLELASKAAGITLEWDGNPEEWIPMYYEGKTYHAWNPLDDDGDAFRLGVGCHLFDEHAGFTYELAAQSGKNTDLYAATRRAIVRAAAEIGRAM